MALSDANKAKIRRHLGYSDVGADPHFRLESAMATLSAAGETEVVALLAEIAAVDSALVTARTTLRLEQVEDIKFSGGSGIAALRTDKSALVGELSSILGVPKAPTLNSSRSGPMQRG